MIDKTPLHRLDLIQTTPGEIVRIRTRSEGVFDEFQILTSGPEPYVDLRILSSMPVDGRPVKILGSCTTEALMDRKKNQCLPQDFMRGVLFGGMRYIMECGPNNVVPSYTNITSIYIVGNQRINKELLASLRR
ncbi:hypothetical protein EB118_01895 [bacterium]|nr:hypothetical protein [bacterium]NBX97917.1 hypothetical protein [bacterium]NDC94309.1 hypothetical protein [bacterium]NDD82791.1 hypothetical protein [bacterium]NDG28839.1 hypothetical protein [bacterium]